MLVTALAPHIGYEKSAKIAQEAHREGISLREAALRLGHVGEAEFDAWVHPDEMTQPSDDDPGGPRSKLRVPLRFWRSRFDPGRPGRPGKGPYLRKGLTPPL